MIAWQTIAISTLTVLGIGACGISVLAFAYGSNVELGSPGTASDAYREGIGFGLLGLVLIAIAGAARFL